MQKSKKRQDQRYEIKRTIKGVYTPNGKPLRKSFYSYISKNDCIRQYEEYIRNTDPKKTYVSSSITLGEWALDWLKIYKLGKVKDNTYRSSYERPVCNIIIPALGRCRLYEIKNVDINRFMSSISSKYSKSMLLKVKNCLYDIFERAEENNFCEKNPCKNIAVRSGKVKNEKRTYSREQVQKILEFATTDDEYGIYVKIMLILGLRPSELCGLKKSDFNFRNNTVSISRAATDDNGTVVVAEPKSKQSKRILPISAEFAKELKEKLPETESGYILQQKTNSDLPISPKNLAKRHNRFFLRCFSELGERFECLSPHELRHTCGTLLYEKTRDIYAVSKYMGHSSIAITATYYVHSDAESLRHLTE